MTSRPPLRFGGDLGLAMPAVRDALNRANIGFVAFLHRNGEFEKWDANDAAMRVLGYTREEWLAMPTFEIVAPGQRDVTAQLYDRLVAGEMLTPSIELMFIHRDGHPVSVEVSYGHAEIELGHALFLIWSDRGTAPGYLSSLESDRISLVSALAAHFAHETNNPLTSVLLNLRSLRKLVATNLVDAKQAAATRVLDDITTGAERIASNVRAFQTLASRSGGQPVDLVGVTSAVLRLAMPTLEPRAHVVRQLADVPPVIGEESRLGQAVLAMLLFAVSGFAASSETANCIVVVVEQRGAVVAVEVSDTGTELAPDELRRAFDPFFRSGSRGPGFGGGLAIARLVAISLGGDVTLAERPGGGAVITMTLPVAPV